MCLLPSPLPPCILLNTIGSRARHTTTGTEKENERRVIETKGTAEVEGEDGNWEEGERINGE